VSCRELVLAALISFNLFADVVTEPQKIFVSQNFDCDNTLHTSLFEDRHEIFNYEIAGHVCGAAESHQPDR
jgi:hypothetical protein